MNDDIKRYKDILKDLNTEIEQRKLLRESVRMTLAEKCRQVVQPSLYLNYYYFKELINANNEDFVVLIKSVIEELEEEIFCGYTLEYVTKYNWGCREGYSIQFHIKELDILVEVKVPNTQVITASKLEELEFNEIIIDFVENPNYLSRICSAYTYEELCDGFEKWKEKYLNQKSLVN